MRPCTKAFAAGVSFCVFTGVSAGAGCLDPALTAEVGVWVDTSRAITFAPGEARMADRGTGEICYGWDVAATIKIVENGAVEYVVEQTNAGAVLYTLDAPASMGSCYTSSINARGAIWRASANDGPVCWQGPACPDANANGVCDAQEPIDKDPNEDTCPGGPPCTSPIILNLEPGRYELSGIDDAVQFDIDADGSPNGITWTARGTATAFLAVDHNDNGTIEDGSELFGNSTTLTSGSRRPMVSKHCRNSTPTTTDS